MILGRAVDKIRSEPRICGPPHWGLDISPRELDQRPPSGSPAGRTYMPSPCAAPLASAHSQTPSRQLPLIAISHIQPGFVSCAIDELKVLWIPFHPLPVIIGQVDQ